MLGFRPVGAAAVAEVDADLVPIDAALRGYEAAWDSHVDAWLVIKARALNCGRTRHLRERSVNRQSQRADKLWQLVFVMLCALAKGPRDASRPCDVLNASGGHARLEIPRASGGETCMCA